MDTRYIFALRSSGNAGKTTSIKLLPGLLQEKYPKRVVTKTYFGDAYHDIKLIIEIGQIKIGIESQGDPNSRLCKTLAEFVAQKCDIIICATRTWGKTVDCVNSYSKLYEIKLIDKDKEFDESKQDESNHSYAMTLLDCISNVIDATPKE